MKKSMLFLSLLASLLGSLSANAQTTPPSPERPVLVKPAAGLEGLPINSVSFWWKYDDDPDVSYQLEKQVLRNALVLAEVSDNGRFFPATYVGDCIFSSNSWEMRSFGARTFASSAECGQQLKPNQWYRWSAYAYFRGGTRLARTGYFKTGEHQDLIIDTTSAGFTKGGEDWDDRHLGYNGNSLLATTTHFETENNFCQWEWTIAEERTYEISVHLLPRYWANPSLATSEQVMYKLWREGIPTPWYNSTQVIDQTQDYHDQWASLGTFHFKAGRATLRLSGSTGESSELGRQFVCDAIRVRRRLGTPELSPDRKIMPSLRKGTRQGTISPFSSPMKRETILSPRTIVFKWDKVEGATSYRLQISSGKDFDYEQECDLYCANVKTDKLLLAVDSNVFAPSVAYYWRVRVENDENEKPSDQLHHFGRWSSVHQFTVIEEPVTPQNALPVVSKEFFQEKGILLEGNYKFKLQYILTDLNTGTWAIDAYPKSPELKSHLAWAQIWHPEITSLQNEKQMPIVLFMHGSHESCQIELEGQKIAYAEIMGKMGKITSAFPPGTIFFAPGTNGMIVKDRKKESCSNGGQKIPNHQGYDYLLEKLASHGIFAISISAHDLQGVEEPWQNQARAELILKFLDKLRDWNDNGTDPWEGIFKGKLAMDQIGLSGHSIGGQAVVTAHAMNAQRDEGTRHQLLAINAIAPQDGLYSRKLLKIDTGGTFLLLQGALDGDLVALPGIRIYDRSLEPKANEENRYPKMMAYVYGANHNYFNTIWTPEDHDWIARDDATIFTNQALERMSAEEQRQVALTTLVAFFRWHLLGHAQYQNLFTGSYKHNRIYWAYQDSNRWVVDNFEQAPETKNTLGGKNSFEGNQPLLFKEMLLHRKEGISAYYNGPYPFGRSDLEADFFHDTMGLRLNWQISDDKQTITYNTQLPEGKRDVSGYNTLNFRIASKEMDISQSYKETLNLVVTLTSQVTEQNKEVTKSSTVQTNQFQRIPYRYERGIVTVPQLNYPVENPIVMTGIRIPLAEFFPPNSEELKNLVEIKITGKGKHQIGIDDIEFAN